MSDYDAVLETLESDSLEVICQHLRGIEESTADIELQGYLRVALAVCESPTLRGVRRIPLQTLEASPSIRPLIDYCRRHTALAVPLKRG